MMSEKTGANTLKRKSK